MELTGKCKEDFEKWWVNDWEIHNKSVGELTLTAWYKLPDSMKYGVFIDYFDSVGLSITIDPLGETTRPEARTSAIEKANEIYNK